MQTTTQHIDFPVRGWRRNSVREERAAEEGHRLKAYSCSRGGRLFVVTQDAFGIEGTVMTRGGSQLPLSELDAASCWRAAQRCEAEARKAKAEAAAEQAAAPPEEVSAATQESPRSALDGAAQSQAATGSAGEPPPPLQNEVTENPSN